jgi:hypothetical protein
MCQFQEVGETSFGWSAQDHTTKLLFPEVTASIRARAPENMAPSGLSKCRACGSKIGKGKSRCIFQWLTSHGWSAPSFVHANAEDCAKVEILDAHQQARYMANQVNPHP